MRQEFSEWIENFGRQESRLIFLTGDLGFAALENVERALDSRFVNMGVSEQNMVSVAAGLAQQGLMPLCYSIAPFAVFRPYEQIRLDVALHNLNVKIIGNGGGYGYGIMGASHHALEDLAVLSTLPNFLCYIPICGSDVAGTCNALIQRRGPGYLRLGAGLWPREAGELPSFAPVRTLLVGPDSQSKVTIVGMGPVLLNIYPWILAKGSADVFVASQLPFSDLPIDLIASVRRSKWLWVIEEHSARGGLGEYLAARLAQEGVQFRLRHDHARGYPGGLYGNQGFHQKKSGLDASSLETTYDSLCS